MAWQQLAGAGGRPEIPVDLDRARTAYESARRGPRPGWVSGSAPTAAGGDLAAARRDPRAAGAARALAARPERLDRRARGCSAPSTPCAPPGMGPLVDDLRPARRAADDVTAELEFVWWTSLAEDLTRARPAPTAPTTATSLRRDRRASTSRPTTPTCAATAERVRAAAGRRLREVLADHPEQEALVRAEARQVPPPPAAARPAAAAPARPSRRSSPCWAMSPLVVASVLPPGRWFDVVIFDEASQVPPAQAISAISRAHQVVVAGDERQLPPTTFFTVGRRRRGARADDRGAHRGLRVGPRRAGRRAADPPPVVALPLARRAAHRLRQRSRCTTARWSPSPAPAPTPVVRLEPVEGSGVGRSPARRPSRRPTAEVDRVVELVLEHARTRPTESLGVIALGIKHADPHRGGAAPAPCAERRGRRRLLRRGPAPSGSSSRTSSASRATSATPSSCRSATARPRTAGCCTASARSTSRAASGASTSPSPGPGAG